MTLYKENSGAPQSSIYKKQVKSAFNNWLKALGQSIGASFERPFIAGKRVSKELNFAEVAAQDSEDLTIDCPGAKVGDQCIVGGPAPAAGSCYTAFVSETDVVTVRYNNYSDGAINPASATFTVTVIPNV